MEIWFTVTVNGHSAKGKNININSPIILKCLTLPLWLFCSRFRGQFILCSTTSKVTRLQTLSEDIRDVRAVSVIAPCKIVNSSEDLEYLVMKWLRRGNTYIDYVIRLQRPWPNRDRKGERDTSDLATILATFPHNRNVSFRSLQHLTEPNLVTLKNEANFSSETSKQTYANDPTRCINS
jgi:hypothetical protein